MRLVLVCAAALAAAGTAGTLLASAAGAQSAPLSSAAPPTAAPASASPARTLVAEIVNPRGAAIGKALLTDSPHGVLIRLEIKADRLKAGWHGLHIHESGDCSDGMAGFKASGKHMGHGEMVQHGLLSDKGPEAGDLPNLFVPAHAEAGGEFFAPAAALSDVGHDGRTPLLGPHGSALIIHANRDDQVSQPVGGAGDRVACAALKAK